MKINCAYQELLSLDDPSIIPNPDNPNDHSEDQIERLAKIIDYQGQRSPIVISNLSGFITKGHGRLMAIKKLGWEKIAVDYQDYENKAQEWADIVADNAIAEWSMLDVAKVKEVALDLEELDLDMLGVKNFNYEELEPEDYSDKNKEIDTENFGNDLQHTCPKCGFEFNE